MSICNGIGVHVGSRERVMSEVRNVSAALFEGVGKVTDAVADCVLHVASIKHNCGLHVWLSFVQAHTGPILWVMKL